MIDELFLKFQAYFLKKRFLPEIFNKIGFFGNALSFNLNVFVLLAMSFDQYYIISRTLKPRVEPKKSWKILLTIWIISLTLSLLISTHFDVEIYDILVRVNLDQKNATQNSSKNKISQNISLVTNLNRRIKYGLIKSSVFIVLTVLIPFILFLIIYIQIGVHFYRKRKTKNSLTNIQAFIKSEKSSKKVI